MTYQENTWQGFKRINFEFEDRNAFLVIPDNPLPDNKWLYKTEYFDAFPSFEIEMLKRGYYVAHLENTNRLCPEKDREIRPRFCEFLISNFSLNKKCVPVGLSCGGMQAVYFAADFPNYVAALYLDAPVLNLLSWPLGLGKSEHPSIEEFKKTFGFGASNMLSYRGHPIDFKEKLLKSEIPIILICGDSDKTVPYDENGKILFDFFEENGGNITLILKENCDHHPHGLYNPQPLVEFVEKYY